MCYRVATPDLIDAEQEFNAKIENPELYPKYFHLNGFSGRAVPVISVDDPKVIEVIDWKNPLDTFNTLNAKCEDIYQPKKFFYKFNDRRGILPVSGFFESHEVKKFNKKTGEPLKTGDKYPYFITMEGKNCFGIACLISPMNTISILTTEPNEMMRSIHNTAQRMPVILHREDYQKWLSKDLMKEEQVNLMRPYESEAMSAHTISKHLYSKEDTNVPHVNQKYIYEGINIPIYIKGQPIFEEGQLSLL